MRPDFLILLCLAAALLVSGCGGPATTSPGPGTVAPAGAVNEVVTGPGIVDTEWQISSVVSPGNERFFERPELFTLRLASYGMASVRADCNQGAGPYTLDGSKLSLSIVATTRAYCGAESFSDEYLRLLGQVERYRLKGNTLTLELRGGAGSITYSK